MYIYEHFYKLKRKKCMVADLDYENKQTKEQGIYKIKKDQLHKETEFMGDILF